MNNAERERAIHLLEYYGEKLGCKTEFDLAIKALELVDNSDKSDDDLISRSALKKIIEDSVSQYGGQYSVDMLNMWALFSHIINDAPTVCHDNYAMGYQDGVKKVLSERPQGEWIVENIIDPYGKCNQCGEICEIDNFCSNCGADMRGRRE